MPTSVQESLSADIHLLGDLLGATIRRLGGEELFALIEEVRGSAKRLRTAHSVEEARHLRDRLDQLEVPELRGLIRAFSVYFDLINLAEQQARVRALRERALAADEAPSKETAEDAFRKVRERGIDAAQLAEQLEHAFVGPVFTAHPSEARRRTVLEKIAAIARELDKIERVQLLPDEQQRAVAAIAEEVEGLWLSEIVRTSRPSVLDEVRQGMHLVETSLFHVVPRVYRKVEAALARVYPDRAWRVPPFLRFGSWIGGDRDGHPNVTHKVTALAVRQQQEVLLSHYLERMEDLWRRLSHSDRFVHPGPAFLDSLTRDHMMVGEMAGAPMHELYRAKCRMISAKLKRTLIHVRTVLPRWLANDLFEPSGVYLSGKPLRDDLEVIAEDLRQAGATSAESGALHDMRRLVEVFGVHMVTLDLREHSARHNEALDEIFRWAGVCPGYAKLTPDARFDLLVRELDQRRPLLPTRLPFSPTTNDVVETFRTTAAILEQQNTEAIRTYIISGATEPAHLLEVLFLAREARLFQPDEGVSRLDIVPLFEALEPLKSASAIMGRLFYLPVYRRHLELRGNLQEVMIGYSDSSKESGILQSSWALYQAQSELAHAARRAGLTVQIFHGRGGSVGRGGGPANSAILAQPHGTVNGRLRMTEQGEVMADRYGHPMIAERHLEQVINAVIRSSFPDESDATDPAWIFILNRLSTSACRHYRALVYDTPEFLTYFEQATPIGEIAQFKIGSRPSRRGAKGGIDQLRAIPWVFSWMQSRHTLPGWYGFGSALKEHLDVHPEELELLQQMYRRWPFWRTLIDNVQMILAKADMTIARLYADLVEDQALAARIYDRIAAEYQRTVDVIGSITGDAELLTRFPILQHSIERRNPYIDPLSFLQLVILKRIRAGALHTEELMTAMLESISGIASGLKNTG